MRRNNCLGRGSDGQTNDPAITRITPALRVLLSVFVAVTVKQTGNEEDPCHTSRSSAASL